MATTDAGTARATAARANITLRVPERLRARLEAAAAECGASLNSEIIARLTRSLDIDEMEAAVERAVRRANGKG